MENVATEVVSEIVLWVVAVAVVGGLMGALFLFKKLGAYIDIKSKTAKDGSVEAFILRAAKLGYSWAEKEGRGLAGSQKADLAYEFAVSMLNRVGINVSAEKLKAAINQAWIELERNPRESGSVNPAQVEQVIKEQFESTLRKET